MDEKEYFERLFDHEFIKLGVLIGKLRADLGYSEDVIAKGLCSRQLLQKLESGNSDTDIRLLRMLISRMGKCPNKLEYIISRSSYSILVMQRDFNECIATCNKDGALNLLKKYQSIVEKDRHRSDCSISKLFFLRNKAMFEYYLCHNRRAAAESIDTCCELSAPLWKTRPLSTYRLSCVELENLLAFVYFTYFDDDGTNMPDTNKSECEHLLSEIDRYINKEVTDDEESAYIIPKFRWLQARFDIIQGHLQSAVSHAEEGLSFLRKYALLGFVRPLLKIIVTCGNGQNLCEPYNNYVNYLSVIDNTLTKYGSPSYQDANLFLSCDRSQYHPDWELLKSQRILRKINREDMIDGIYENVESLSRVENGKASPNKTTLPKMMKKLRLEWMRNNTALICSNFDALEKLENVNLLLSTGAYSKAKEVINELSQLISLDMKRNQRVINTLQNNITFYQLQQGLLDSPKTVLSTMISSLEDNISDTYPSWNTDFIRVPMSDEISSILQLEVCYKKLGKKEIALSICHNVIRAYENSAIDCAFNCRWYGLLLTNYAQTTADPLLSKKALSFMLSVGSLDGADRAISNIAIQMHQRDNNHSENHALLYNALILSKFLYNSAYISSLKSYLSKHTEESEQTED